MKKTIVDGTFIPAYHGAKLTFAKPVSYDEFPPEWPEEKDLGENDLFGSFEVTITVDELNSLKRFIRRCEKEMAVKMVFIMDKENWKKLFKGHANKMLLSMTFEDCSDWTEISDGEPLEED